MSQSLDVIRIFKLQTQHDIHNKECLLFVYFTK